MSFAISHVYFLLAVATLLSALIWTYHARRLRLVDPKSSSKASLRNVPKGSKHTRLSRPPWNIKPSYDVVVIGSGYGGGVAASRFARASKTVCVLERGTEKWPGEYPHTAKDARKEYNVSGRVCGKSLRIGKGTGLYQTIKGEGQDVFVGCGLGGTSLINAGVWLRADERILRGNEWPAEIRETGLRDYYERGERMFQPTPYPATAPTPLKLSCLQVLARNLGLQSTFHRPPVTTAFSDGRNQSGVGVKTCTGSGNECTGTNDGSKSSVLVTYLADAWARGAEIFCGTNVKYVKKREMGGGYVIFFEMTEADGGRRKSWVIANDLVILGAGAIGTPAILLRSRRHGLAVSPLLGQRLSGNGDMLSFAYNCDRDLSSIGHEPSIGCGPTIAGCIDLRDHAHTRHSARDGVVVQDGAVPEVLSPIIQTLLETHRSGSPSKSYHMLRGSLARLKAGIFGPYFKGGSVQRTMVFLTMSHDEDEGNITLEDDEIAVKWEGASEAGKRTSRVLELLKTMTEQLGGMFVKSPAMTVHPLGGAVMSNDDTGLGGVVSHRGELFAGPGVELHKGIFCVDGSVVPTSLGVNPCATITALAERTCDLIVRERDWEFHEGLNGELDIFDNPPSPQGTKGKGLCKDPHHPTTDGVRFLETMEGHIHVGSSISDFQTSERAAKNAASGARLDLKVTVGRDHVGVAHGEFACGALSRDPLLIINGSVSFFTTDSDVSDARSLVYRLDLMSTKGEVYNLHGYKRVDPGITLSVLRTWNATTTLYTTIRDSAGTSIGRGVLHLNPIAFASAARSLCSMSKAVPCLEFLSFFAQNLAPYFFTPICRLQQPAPSLETRGYYEKPASRCVTLTAEDGMLVPLKIWHPRHPSSTKHTPLLLIPGASVNEQIFSLPTIPINTIDYFTSLGHTCYVPILRFCAGENARYGHTAFDARLDVQVAINYVYQQERTKVYVIAHCLGSIATAMALLTGMVDADRLAGMTVSQVFAHIIFGLDNAFKAEQSLLIKLYENLSSSPWFPIATSSRVRFLDTLLRFYPVGSRRELCRSAACHRCDVPFGRCWTHSNLNHATHQYLDRFFDGIHTQFLRHLSKMGAAAPRHVRTNLPEFEDLVVPENLGRLQGIKIAFLYGNENTVWDSRATKASYDAMRAVFPLGDYERIVVQGYGHLDCWMGRSAFQNVWPRVARHIRLSEESKVEGEYVIVRSKS